MNAAKRRKKFASFLQPFFLITITDGREEPVQKPVREARAGESEREREKEHLLASFCQLCTRICQVNCICHCPSYIHCVKPKIHWERCCALSPLRLLSREDILILAASSHKYSGKSHVQCLKESLLHNYVSATRHEKTVQEKGLTER